jgi:predicted TIM-barrel fold metal-dependent hydrolase
MHDADSHIMEPPAWLEGHLAQEHRSRLPVLGAADAPSTQGFDIERVRQTHAGEDYRAEDASQILLRKNFFATGSFIEADRPRALDLLGFASQLVFDTFTSSHVLRIEREDAPFATEVARGQHRAMLAWCGVDPRLLPVCIVPLGDMPAAITLTREAIAGGAAALQIGQYCPPGHSPSHIDLEPMWAMAAEAGVPVVLHVAGAGANVMNPAFFENGLPPVPDFHGGDGNFKSIDYMSIPLPVMQTLNALVIDGVRSATRACASA